MEAILATLGIGLMIVLAIFYVIPLLGTWILLIYIGFSEGVSKRDAWMVWLMVIGAVVPTINIVIFIILLKTIYE